MIIKQVEKNGRKWVLDAVKSRINRTRESILREKRDPCVMCGTTDLRSLVLGLCRAACVWCVTVARMTTSGTGGWLWRESGQRGFSTRVRTQDGRTKNSEDWVNMCLITLQSRG